MKTNKIWTVILMLLSIGDLCIQVEAQEKNKVYKRDPVVTKTIKEYKDIGLGMFIHWGRLALEEQRLAGQGIKKSPRQIMIVCTRSLIRCFSMQIRLSG